MHTEVTELPACLVAAAKPPRKSLARRRSPHRSRSGPPRPRTRIAATVALIAATALTAGVSGCVFPPRHGAANAIGDTIRQMPGVSAANVRYDTSITNGAHFDLDVTLADTASDTQAAAMGRTFVDRMRDAYFGEFEVKLAVTYKANPDPDAGAPGSRAEFDYNFDLLARGGPSSSDVADSLALWFQTAQSPVSAGTTLLQPKFSGPAGSRSITVVLARSVTDAAIAELIHVHPDLDRATWVMNIPSPQRFRHPRTYQVRGQFPDQQRRALWQQIVDQLASGDEARASTDTIDAHAGAPPTTVEIDLNSGSDEPQRFEHVARAVVPLLPGFGLPVGLRLMSYVDTIEFTIGGCDRPDPRRTLSALEKELRRQYQHC